MQRLISRYPGIRKKRATISLDIKCKLAAKARGLKRKYEEEEKSMPLKTLIYCTPKIKLFAKYVV